MNTNICIQGDGTPEYGRKIIDYLQSLGGVNSFNLTGYQCTENNLCYYYYIIDGRIWSDYRMPLKLKLINLKEMDQIKQPTKEQILEAANKCPQAKETLKTLFPEVFDDDKYLSINELIHPYGYVKRGMVDMRIDGNFKHKGYYLYDKYNWEIIKDNQGELCLIPTKKR